MVQNELRYALERRKLVIPIVRTDLAGHPLLAQFPRLFTFSPWDNPGTVETQDRRLPQRATVDQRQTTNDWCSSRTRSRPSRAVLAE
jgi:hypothetical protein